mmetsp:Transcript_4549/g.6819  ORF Transcript_4549/g.6819 Transcript_4549/m.6819 type:complete len:128 (+) Transcript_4549:1210-1593(+)
MDENLSPSEWKCEDCCLTKEDNLICGRTDHFTSFALLFVDDRAHGPGSCYFQPDYITGALGDDIILIASTIACVVAIAVVVSVVIAKVAPVRNVVFGEEGSRILRTRSARRATVEKIGEMHFPLVLF